MIVIYRYSEDNSQGKQKIASKLQCFENFASTAGTFAGVRTILLVDHSFPEESLSALRDIWKKHKGLDECLTVEKRDCSSASKSQLAALDFIISDLSTRPGYETVYMLEDDYLHLDGSLELLEEGLTVCDYVTLYDHPDKYQNPSPNPELSIKNGSAGELTRILLTDSAHWKETNSTTMTFAARLSVWRSDIPTMKTFCLEEYPKDYEMFVRLREFGRSIGVCIPGRATHTETAWLSPLIDWEEIV